MCSHLCGLPEKKRKQFSCHFLLKMPDESLDCSDVVHLFGFSGIIRDEGKFHKKLSDFETSLLKYSK